MEEPFTRIRTDVCVFKFNNATTATAVAPLFDHGHLLGCSHEPQTAYIFPNDQEELDRQEFQYVVIKHLMNGKLFFAPWTDENPPRNVLDIATGAGHWAIEMGDKFPSARITGTDLSPVQPRDVPANVRFFVEDRYVKFAGVLLQALPSLFPHSCPLCPSLAGALAFESLATNIFTILSTISGVVNLITDLLTLYVAETRGIGTAKMINSIISIPV
jgi:hypothetical protein